MPGPTEPEPDCLTGMDGFLHEFTEDSEGSANELFMMNDSSSQKKTPK